jgi:hypothetical protein
VLTYFLSDFEMFLVAPVITGITLVFALGPTHPPVQWVPDLS